MAIRPPFSLVWAIRVLQEGSTIHTLSRSLVEKSGCGFLFGNRQTRRIAMNTIRRKRGKNIEQQRISDHDWRMTQEDLRDLRRRYPEEDDGSYQWWENGVEYRSWNGVKSEYRNAETDWKWKPWKA